MVSDRTNPSAVSIRGRHLGALDGVRGVAVAGVVAYHLGVGWMSGGYLGVDLFFVLSGFLITSLLVEERATSGRIDLGDFYRRRARRLFPGLFAMVALVCISVAILIRLTLHALANTDLTTVREDAFATLAYSANWHSIITHQTYFARYEMPSPLQHAWSLAIEEQYYLVWPLVLISSIAWCCRRDRRVHPRVLGVAAMSALALASSALMAFGYHAGWSITRLYDGTDTRMSDLLVGGVAALLLIGRKVDDRVLRVAGPASGILLALAWVWGGTASEQPKALFFDGGFLLCALAAAVLIAAAASVNRGVLAALLGSRPLVWLGTISYSIYLWHWPIVVFMNHTSLGLSTLPLDVVRVASILVVSWLSYRYIEAPFRRRRVRPRVLVRNLSATLAVTVGAVLVATYVVPTSTVSPAAAEHGSSAGLSGIGGVLGSTDWTPDPTRQLSVALIGDSVMRAAAPALRASLAASGDIVYDLAADGFGLVTDRSWRTDLVAQIRRSGAELVIATWSWDDACGPRDPTPLSNGLKGPCALEEPVRYRARLESFVRALLDTTRVREVVFAQFPRTGPTDALEVTNARAIDSIRARGEAAWDSIVRGLATSNGSSVLYLAVGGSVLLKGGFTSWLAPLGSPRAPRSDWVRVRTIDNVHLCPAGAARYALAVETDLARAWGRTSVPIDWLSGRWASNPIYDTPVGACPADHPPSR